MRRKWREHLQMPGVCSIDEPPDTEGLDGSLLDTTSDVKPIPIPTGLSDEDDARSYLAQRFNGLFCPCCENYWNKEDVVYDRPEEDAVCPICTVERNDPIFLQPFGQERPWRDKSRTHYTNLRLSTTDPHIKGELWSNNGHLEVSRG